MRAIFGVVGLLVVLATVALLAKKQLNAVQTPSVGIVVPQSGASQVVSPQQLPEHVRQSMERAMQQERPMPDDK